MKSIAMAVIGNGAFATQAVIPDDDTPIIVVENDKPRGIGITQSKFELTAPQAEIYAYVDRPYTKPKKPNKGLKIGSYSSKSKKKR